MSTNPFRPSFGASPPVLAGRAEELEVFTDALDAGPGAPGRAMLVTGPRGSGKTVMLNALEDAARQRGWLVISQTARRGVADEIRDTQLPALLGAYADDAIENHVTGANLSLPGIGGGMTRTRTENYPVTPSLRFYLEKLTDALSPGLGVVLSLDELHPGAGQDLERITQAVQHAFREDRQVALVAAGLPLAVDDLLTVPGMTFIRRAERFSMNDVPLPDVRYAIQIPIEQAGRRITPEALEVLAEGAEGYSFLVQLVGYHAWNSNREHDVISLADAHVGVDKAVARLGRLVHEAALKDISDVDRAFVTAMAVDDGPSRISDVATRLGTDGNNANQYRRRLIEAELIEPAGHGLVQFTLPHLRDHLRSRYLPLVDDASEDLPAPPRLSGAGHQRQAIVAPRHERDRPRR